jgi:phosphate:Na+ symporter
LSAAFTLIAGLGVFLTGMNMLSGGLQSAVGPALKKRLPRLPDNPLVGMSAGALAAAAVNGSGAVALTVIGLVNAGIISLTQAVNIIIGANIGTTLSGLIVALESLDITVYLSALSFAGLLLTALARRPALKRAGVAVTGLGLIFTGLSLLSASAAGFRDTGLFGLVFAGAKSPFLLVLAGVLLTAVFQSSAAVNGLIILVAVPYGAGGLDIIDGVYIILGTNTGSCITAIIASAGRGAAAKRAAAAQLIFNAAGTVFFAVLFGLTPPDMAAAYLQRTFSANVKFQLAWFNLFENLLSAAAALPFIRPLAGLTERLVRDNTDGQKMILRE